MQKLHFPKLLASIAFPLTIGAVSGFATSAAIPTWYTTLNQPSFNPPNWLFGPVWTTLYILMGISLYLIWNLPQSPERQKAILVFLGQMVLNFGWSFLFFYFKRIDLALIEIVVLWSSIVWMIMLFKQLKPVAGWMNLPYLAWVSFATILNAAYFWLN